MTSEIYNKVFDRIKQNYNVEKVNFCHLICEMEKYPKGCTNKAEVGLTAVAFLKNLQETNALDVEDETYNLMYTKIIEDM